MALILGLCRRCEAGLDEDGYCNECGEDFAGTQSRKTDG